MNTGRSFGELSYREMMTLLRSSKTIEVRSIGSNNYYYKTTTDNNLLVIKFI